MFGIIISFVAAVLCIISCGYQIYNREPISAIFFGFLSVFNIGLFFLNLTNYNSNEIERHEIENVIRYDIDSTLTISGNDTTKTYTIYYYE